MINTHVESNIHAPVLLNNLLNSWKRDKMIGKPHIFSLFRNLFNKFSNTWSHILYAPNVKEAGGILISTGPNEQIIFPGIFICPI